MRKPAIPAVNSQDQTLSSAIAAIKENIEIITGARPTLSPMAKLPTGASLSDIVAKVNEVITRINFDGN